MDIDLSNKTLRAVFPETYLGSQQTVAELVFNADGTHATYFVNDKPYSKPNEHAKESALGYWHYWATNGAILTIDRSAPKEIPQLKNFKVAIYSSPIKAWNTKEAIENFMDTLDLVEGEIPDSYDIEVEEVSG